MALIDEDFARCKSCGGYKFAKEEIVVISNTAPKRSRNLAPGVEPMTVELPLTESEILYKCITCNQYFD